jgi:hypothetical protein
LQDLLLNAWVLQLFTGDGFNVEIDLITEVIAAADTPLDDLLGTVLLGSLALSLSALLDAMESDGELLLDLL